MLAALHGLATVGFMGSAAKLERGETQRAMVETLGGISALIGVNLALAPCL